MGGLFVDIFVEWIVRMIAKLVNRVRSSSWPQVQGIVTAVRCERAGYGCHLADVHFDYEYQGAEFSGLHEEPFIMHALHRLLSRSSAGKPSACTGEFAGAGEGRVYGKLIS